MVLIVVALVGAVGVGGAAALWSRSSPPSGSCARTLPLPGMPLVATGLGLNAPVIAINGAMRVAPSAIEAVGGRGAPAGRQRLLEEGDALPFLADVAPLPPLATVVSVGDVILAAGVGLLVVALMRRSPAQPVEGRGQTVAQ